MYWDTDADTDGSLYVCRDTNTWKEVDDGYDCMEWIVKECGADGWVEKYEKELATI